MSDSTRKWTAVGLGVAIAALGASLALHPDRQTTVATVDNVVCPPNSYQCTVNVTYTVKGQTYSNFFETRRRNLQKGSTISVHYLPEDPMDIEAGPLPADPWPYLVFAFGLAAVVSSLA